MRTIKFLVAKIHNDFSKIVDRVQVRLITDPQEIKEPLEVLLAAFHAYETGGQSDELDRALRTAWAAFDRARMEKLLGCL